MWTTDRKGLKKKLKSRFERVKKRERPVDVKEAWSLDFLGYQNKMIKVTELLRSIKTHLSELLLALDGMDPLECMVLTRVKIVAQQDGFRLQLVKKRKSPGR